MAKEKFQLTTDLVRVESEPTIYNVEKNGLPVRKNPKENTVRLTINIDINLKQKLQFFAINNRKNMTDIIEEAIREKLLNHI